MGCRFSEELLEIIMTVKEHYDNHLANFYSWMTGDFETIQIEFLRFQKCISIFHIAFCHLQFSLSHFLPYRILQIQSNLLSSPNNPKSHITDLIRKISKLVTGVVKLETGVANPSTDVSNPSTDVSNLSTCVSIPSTGVSILST